MATQKIGCGAIILTTHFAASEADHPFFKQLDDTPRILLIRRGFGSPTFPSAWAAPAGIKEKHERPERAAEREGTEEVGICGSAGRYPFYRGKWKDRELEYFLMYENKFLHPEGVRLGLTEVGDRKIAECIGFDWCTYEEAAQKDLAFRWREAIEKLREARLL